MRSTSVSEIPNYEVDALQFNLEHRWMGLPTPWIPFAFRSTWDYICIIFAWKLIN